MTITIRPMRKQDNPAMLAVIQQCVTEFGYPHSPYVTQPEEADIFANYTHPLSRMYVLEDAEGHIVGGGGFAPLEGMEDLCEIMQVYFLPRVRGLGLGKKLVTRLMEEASDCGFAGLYIESVPELTTAIRLYESLGFEHIPERLGTGGHAVCTVFMRRPPLPRKQRSA